jgi:hypothetical protein
MAVGVNTRHWVAGICALCLAGCGPIIYTVKTSICQPIEYCNRYVNCEEDRRNRALAETALAAYWGNCGATLSEDFANGFKDGYATYLFKGGTGNPPALPPRCYWQAQYENTHGHAAIQDWFDGYRAGTAVAMKSGYRNLVTIPASTGLPMRTTSATKDGQSVPGEGNQTQPLPDESLPLPRQVSPKLEMPGPAGSTEWSPPANPALLPAAFHEDSNRGASGITWVPCE